MLLKYTVKPEKVNELIDLYIELENDLITAELKNLGMSHKLYMDSDSYTIEVKVLDLEERVN